MLKNKKGFSLIELMVVVLIIAILAGIALPQYRAVVERTKITTNIPIMKGLFDSIVQYYAYNGEFPNTFSKLAVTPSKGDFTISMTTLTKKDNSCVITLNATTVPPSLELTGKSAGGDINDWVMSYKFVVATSADGGGLFPGDRIFKVQTTDPDRQAMLRRVALASGWQDQGGNIFKMP